ncbi:hypothetical protein CBR_g2948 [Chara braunii]|uniref:Uncharacterized protein n=1 Tax=Chara braunii TaxID=69332 RepID=A0A388KEM2_CHABU|nr:hypothetical protein CBR_g2948 [Chara braunii]|eukprot:GBG68403.1 hypothetical protein CBR_g2948 [Chara braunii]
MKTAMVCVLVVAMGAFVLASSVGCGASEFEFEPVFTGGNLPNAVGGLQRSFVPGAAKLVLKEDVADDSPCEAECKVEAFMCKARALYAKGTAINPSAAQVQVWEQEINKCSQALEGCHMGCSRF